MVYNHNDEFTEKAQQGFQDVYESQKLAKLTNSKVVKQWLQFYKELFSLELKLENFKELGERGPGSMIIIVPKEVTIQKCFDLLKKKVGKFECYLEKPDEIVMRARLHEGDYILHEKYYNTLLELLICDLFAIFQGKPITTKVQTNPFKHHNSYVVKNKSIYVWVSVDLPWKKDKKGDYTIPPKYNLKKVEYKIWEQS